IASGEYYFWDVLAAEVVVDRERFCRGRWRSLKVRHPTAQTPWMPTSDTTMPGSNWQGEPRRHLNAATAGAVVPAAGEAGVLVCRETDAEAAFELFIDTLTGEAPSH
ncbi:MAG: purine nucleoside permease, partial [Gammaproteobacteria bacterium]|nr:purine nucleoside permease [Gammaproteobacteria bacterium]NIY31346.1 purine nucleoside permease [Gammaproteobacteria bacterium]